MLHKALDRVEREGLTGLVIGNEDPRTFSAGADLYMVLKLVGGGDWKKVEDAVRGFQETSLRIRRSPFPVVSAPFGLTLGGGTEFSLHADRVQAHAELYMGLVEVGVGLIPAGGGTTEMLFRFATELAPYAEADPFEGVKRAFQLIAMATTSTSALEARKLGYSARRRSHHDESRSFDRRRGRARGRSRAGLCAAASARHHRDGQGSAGQPAVCRVGDEGRRPDHRSRGADRARAGVRPDAAATGRRGK